MYKGINYKNKTPKPFYNIVHKHYLKECDKIKRTKETKKTYYSELKIKGIKDKIKRLKNDLKIEQNKLNGLL